jgi:hypothetical protein
LAAAVTSKSSSLGRQTEGDHPHSAASSSRSRNRALADVVAPRESGKRGAVPPVAAGLGLLRGGQIADVTVGKITDPRLSRPVDLALAASRAHQPVAPLEHRHPGAVSRAISAG